MEAIQYKCPNCGGKVEFDSTTQRMKCPFCESEFDPQAVMEVEQSSAVEMQGDDLQWTATNNTWSDSDQDGVRSFVCQSCGGEIVGDANTAATECPFCGNPVVLSGQVSGQLKPDLIIPFKLDKKAAKDALRKHIATKKLVPRLFKSENHLDEIKGIYVPFWLFSGDADADIQYQAEKVRTWSDSNYNYTETSYFNILRSGTIGFDAIPVDGSAKMDNTLMESIEPFDISQAVDFKSAYLSGYLADKYDVASEACESRANERVKASTENAFASTVEGYTSVKPTYSGIRLLMGQRKYALYPVWLLNTSWNGQKYTFAMNGQTGKLVGDLPLDKGAFWKWVGILTAGIGTLSYVLLYFLM